MMRTKLPTDSFVYALEGVLHCFRSQRHMQVHFMMLVLVLVAALMLGVEMMGVLILMLCIAMVMATELINTAIETVVDMVSKKYEPLAKLAKDVAAGAVLVASVNAAVCGSLIFLRTKPVRYIAKAARMQPVRPDPLVVAIVGILVIATIVMISKLRAGRSNAALWQGGPVSGHSAVGFFLAVTVIFSANSALVTVLALLLAAIIAQSRVEARIHSIHEVVMGALVGLVLTTAIYWLMPYIRQAWADGHRSALPLLPVLRLPG